MEKRVTIHDVARQAEVSHTTVSWALNGDTRIRPETRDRVVAAALAMGYHPHHSARCLVSGRSFTIGLVSRCFSSSFESEIIRGLEETFSAWGSSRQCSFSDCRRVGSGEPVDAMDVNLREALEYSVTQINLGSSEESASDQCLRLLREQRVDALIALARPRDLGVLHSFTAAGKPLVLIEDECPGHSSVRGDSRLGAKLATSYLVGLGRRNIGIVLGSEEYAKSYSERERYRGYAEALKKAGLAPSPGHRLYCRRHRFESGAAVLDGALSSGLDAVFCASGDMVAMGILDAARRRGVAVPRDLAVVGYDDLLPSRIVSPSLTSVSNPISSLSSLALCLCLRGISQKSVELGEYVFKPSLIVRESA